VFDDETTEIADWLVRLTANRKRRGFGLCVLYLRHAWPDQAVFETREEAQEHATKWLWTTTTTGTTWPSAASHPL